MGVHLAEDKVMQKPRYWAVAYSTDNGRHYVTIGCNRFSCQTNAEADATAYAKKMGGTVFRSPTTYKVREYAESIGL